MFDDTLISIHAPTRGATILCNHRGLVFGFQSTLPREERQRILMLSTLIIDFNPRSHERSDYRQTCPIYLHMYFNPRSHERSDKLFVAVKVWYPIFQSTLPREERQENGIEYDDLLDISIHAPTRGATIQELSQYNADTISIHAPTRGATP